MNREAAVGIAKEAAQEVLKEYRRESRKKEASRIFRNTRVLMENYTKIKANVEEGISSVQELNLEQRIEAPDEDELFIASIRRSKLRSLVMVAHIEKCLQLLERDEQTRRTPERYRMFTYYFIEGMSYEAIAELSGTATITARRWINELLRKMSIYLFGIDGVMLE